MVDAYAKSQEAQQRGRETGNKTKDEAKMAEVAEGRRGSAAVAHCPLSDRPRSLVTD